MRKTSELPNFRTQRRLGRVFSDLFSVAFSHSDGTETRAAKQLGDDTILKQSAPLLLSRSRPHRGWAKQASERTLRGGGIAAALHLRPPPRTYARRGAKSDVRHPIKRSRRSSGVAMASYEDANRSGREICTMRYLGRVAMDNYPRELTCRPEEEPIMASQLGRAPRRQRRLGYLSGGVDRPYGEKTN